MWPDRIGLEHHAEIALVGGQRRTGRRLEHDAIAEGRCVRRGFLETGDRAQRGGLAATRRTEQREELAVSRRRGRYHEHRRRWRRRRIELGQIFDPQHAQAPANRPADRATRAPCGHDKEGETLKTVITAVQTQPSAASSPICPLFQKIEQGHRDHLRRGPTSSSTSETRAPPAETRTASTRSAPAPIAAARP